MNAVVYEAVRTRRVEMGARMKISNKSNAFMRPHSYTSIATSGVVGFEVAMENAKHVSKHITGITICQASASILRGGYQ